MIRLSPRAAGHVNALSRHYERLGRLEALQHLRQALFSASTTISIDPHAGLRAPPPYPSLAAAGRLWVFAHRYWIAYRLNGPGGRPIIVGVYYDEADIPRRR